jgi:hypothetical protein
MRKPHANLGTFPVSASDDDGRWAAHTSALLVGLLSLAGWLSLATLLGALL